MTPLDHDSFIEAAENLTSVDPAMAQIVSEHGMPDFWNRPPGFATLALFIVEQQVSLASAKAVFERLVEALGEVSPGTLAGADPDTLGRAGLTRQKQRYLTGLAQLVVTADLDLVDVGRRSDEDARAALLAITGIGPWTADVYLLSALRRPDVWPAGDRALQVGVGERLGLASSPDVTAVEEIGERWRPYRSVAARLIWHDYLRRRNRAETEVAGLGPDTRASSARPLP